MPRAIWSGAISFGLVTIPVKLFSSVSKKQVSFNRFDTRTESKVKQKLVSAADGSEVEYSDLVKGYEISSGNFVTITDEELESLDPPTSRAIDIIEFVDEDEVDPLVYDKAYYLAPDELAMKAYKVLVEALEEANKVAVAKLVMRTKQYIATVRPRGGHLMLSTMVYADEINAAEDIDGLDGLEGVEIREAEIAMARALIDSLSADFEHGKFEDEHRTRVLDLIQRKAEGEITIVDAPAAKTDGKVVDLMAALEASVAAAKEARGRHPSASEAADAEVAEAAEPTAAGETGETGETVKKAATKKTTAKKTTAKKKAAAKKAAPKRAAAKTRKSA